MKPCPLCGYMMDPFDTECRRCHGKGIPKPAMDPFAAAPVAAPAPAAAPTPIPTIAAATPPPSVTTTPSHGASPPFVFMVTDGGSTQDPRIFRVYEDGNCLLFINAGHYHINGMTMVQQMSLEARARRRGDALPASSQNIADKAVEAASNAWVSYVEWYKKSKTEADPRQRAPMLDVMTLEELRAESQTDKYSFTVRRENVEDVKMRPRKTGFSLDEKGVEGFLTFRHTQTGKWPLKWLTLEDYQEGSAMVERVIGADRIKKG